MKINVALSHKIANMSFVCACLIVCTHTPIVEGLCVSFVRQALTGIAVPVFFIISGFFLGLQANSDGWYARVVKKRFKTLVVPFVLLNVCWWPIKYGIHYVGVHYFGASDMLRSMDITLYNFLAETGFFPWGGSAIMALWYMKCLFLLVCLSPLFVWVVRKGCCMTFVMALVLLAIWCFQKVFAWPVFLQNKITYELSARCPLYLMIGLFFSRYSYCTLARWQRAAMVLLGCCGVYCALHFENSGWLWPARWFAIVLSSAAGVWAIMPSTAWPRILVGNSFAIYVFHCCFLFLIEKFCGALHCWGTVKDNVGFYPVVGIVIVLCILLAESIRRVLPRFASQLLGGR